MVEVPAVAVAVAAVAREATVAAVKVIAVVEEVEEAAAVLAWRCGGGGGAARVGGAWRWRWWRVEACGNRRGPRGSAGEAEGGGVAVPRLLYFFKGCGVSSLTLFSFSLSLLFF